ncbi:hypothetical protein FGO68_gene11654 [Halteria grandinella]|uniref:RNase III domain-containing protein n=1 Tax=Halteria grandinella TaxID=5974 RepID=A0A8J8TAD1_HALGN|nr:hypothetical protein FGO68_gene11654 [Halteria grandinella]
MLEADPTLIKWSDTEKQSESESGNNPEFFVRLTKHAESVGININRLEEKINLPKELLPMIDLPEKLLKTLDNYENKPKINETIENIENRSKFRLILLLLTLTLTSSDVDKLEMSRLEFVGDSAISLGVVAHLIYCEKEDNQEKELDSEKTRLTENQVIEQRAEAIGLQEFLLEPKSDVIAQMRKLHLVAQGIVGFLSLYVGMDAALLLLYNLNIIDTLPGLAIRRRTIQEFMSDEDMVTALKQMSELKHKQTNGNLAKGIITFLFYQNIEQFTQLKPSGEQYVSNMKKQQRIENWKLHQLLAARLVYFSTIRKYIKGKDDSRDQHVSSREGSKERDNENINSNCSCDQNSSLDQDNLFEPRLRYDENDQTGGYRFKLRQNLLEALTHKSAQELLMQKINKDKIQINVATLKKIKEMMIEDVQLIDIEKLKEIEKLISSGDENIQFEQLKKDLAMFNYQRLEYLGDSILNFSLAKLFYFDTINYKIGLDYKNLYYSDKLHMLKTSYSSNYWLASLICEHYFFSLQKNMRHALKSNMVQHDERGTKLKNLLPEIPLIPILYDCSNLNFDNQLKTYQCKAYMKMSLNYQNRKYHNSTGTKDSLSINLFQSEAMQAQETIYDGQQLVKGLSDIHEAIIAGIFNDSNDFTITNNCVLKLLATRYNNDAALGNSPKERVINLLRNKCYLENCKLEHTTVDDKQKNVQKIKLYIDNIEARRIQFNHETRGKLERSFIDLISFLTEACLQFEILNQYQGKDFTKENFLDFIREFRKVFKITNTTKNSGLFKVLCLKAFENQANQHVDKKKQTLLDYLTAELRKLRPTQNNPSSTPFAVQSIATQSTQSQTEEMTTEYHSVSASEEKQIGPHPNFDVAQYQGFTKPLPPETLNVILLEHDRFCSHHLRNYLAKAGIKNIKGKSFDIWLNGLEENQIIELYEQMVKIGQLVDIKGKSSEETGQSWSK